MSDVILQGTYSYKVDPSTDTVNLNVTTIANESSNTTGTLRIELWLTTDPWNPDGSNSGWEIATDRITGSSNGTLSPGYDFNNISVIAPYVNHPPAGTYYVTLAVAEYTGANPSVDNGYVIDTSGSFSNLLNINTLGSVSNFNPNAVYNLSTDGQSQITEGGGEIFKLSTSGIAAGTALYYSLTGVTSNQINGGALSGSVTVDSNGEAVIAVSLTSAPNLGLYGKLTASISDVSGGTSLATASVGLNETVTAPPSQGGVSLVAGSVIATPGQTVNLSSMFNLQSSAENKTFIDVTMLDRNEYTGSNSPISGHFVGNGDQVGNYIKGTDVSWVGFVPTDAVDSGIIFIYQPNLGRYYNQTYGYLDQLQFYSSTNQFDNTYITLFATNSASVIDALMQAPALYYADPETLAGLAAQSGAGIVGTVDVISRNDIASGVLTAATPNNICLAADTFVGKTWNVDGCWVLASNIAAQAGCSLPATTPGGASLTFSGHNPTAPISNGEWIVAYNGGAQTNPTIASAEALVRPGDVITMDFASGGGHITTVVSGNGSSAQVIDNTVFVSSSGTYLNSANDGYANDIVIQGPHSLASILTGGNALPATINIYRLDTPTISISTASASALEGSSISLAQFFTATDAGGAGTRAITEYAIYDTTTGGASGDAISWTGGTQSAHGSQSEVIISASAISSLTLAASQSAGNDTFYVSAYNGAYWGDAASFSVAVTGDTASAVVTNSASIVAPVQVSDTAANVAANLTGLEAIAAEGKIASITLTDGGIPTLSISAGQLITDAAAINDISGNFSLAETAPSSSAVAYGAANALGNTMVFSGIASQYTITPAGDGVHFTVATGGSSDRLGNFQALQFADITEIVAPTPGGSGVVTGGNITELYGAVFGRVPDVPGLDYYEKELAANPGLSLVSLAQNFLQSPEYTGNSAHSYAQTADGDAQFITDSYNNLLNRAPESSAIPYYQNLISQFTKGLTPGTNAYAAAELQAHATVLVDFSASAEFLGDVQVTAANPASVGFTGHWLVLI